MVALATLVVLAGLVAAYSAGHLVVPMLGARRFAAIAFGYVVVLGGLITAWTKVARKLR